MGRRLKRPNACREFSPGVARRLAPAKRGAGSRVLVAISGSGRLQRSQNEVVDPKGADFGFSEARPRDRERNCLISSTKNAPSGRLWAGRGRARSWTWRARSKTLRGIPCSFAAAGDMSGPKGGQRWARGYRAPVTAVLFGAAAGEIWRAPRSLRPGRRGRPSRTTQAESPPLQTAAIQGARTSTPPSIPAQYQLAAQT